MEPKLPISVPTDSFYKFISISAMILTMYFCGAMIYLLQSQRDVLLDAVTQYEKASSEAVKNVIADKLKRDESDKKLLLAFCEALFAVFFWIMVFGFRWWYTRVQVVQDKLLAEQLNSAKLQSDKLALEIKKLEAAN